MQIAARLAVLVWAIQPGVVTAKPTIVRDGEWEYKFDDARISAKLLSSVLPFSGHSMLFSDATAICPVPKLRDYADLKGWDAWPTWGPEWLKQARATADQEANGLAPLRELKIPAELEAARNFSLNELLLHHHIDLALLDLLESNSSAPLERQQAGLTPGTICQNAVKKAASEPSRALKFRTAAHDWNNCVIGNAKMYPKRSWEAFLRKYRIRESRHSEENE